MQQRQQEERQDRKKLAHAQMRMSAASAANTQHVMAMQAQGAILRGLQTQGYAPSAQSVDAMFVQNAPRSNPILQAIASAQPQQQRINVVDDSTDENCTESDN